MSTSELKPLPKLGEGCFGTVRAVQGGRGMAQRLAEMGISSGTVVKVIRGRGPMIVEAKGHRLVLGHGMVGHILVEPVEGVPPG